MLIRFSFQNWMSFRDKTEISTIGGKQRTHIERVAKLKKYKINILPVVAIYGGNASGKSNILKALDFAQKLVIKGPDVDEPIDVQPFLLDSDSINLPSKFWFELLINEKVYEFSFSVTREKICEEKLTEIRPTTEKVLYERENKIKVHDKANHTQFEHIIGSTRDNQLFLTNCIAQNNEKYKGIYEWFRYYLKLIAPDARFGNLEDLLNKELPYYDEVNIMLKDLDTGVSRIGDEVVQDKTTLMFSKEGQKYLNALEFMTGERYIKEKKNGEELTKKLVLYHEGEEGKEVKFGVRQESDGTKRLMDIIPSFMACTKVTEYRQELGQVYMIDELDRSLHHLLIRRLLQKFLSSCNADTRAQIIFTTHDLLLMDQKLLRRDEMFVVERNDFGVTSVIPLNEYRGIRHDKDILKSYIQGRFGGIPRL